MTLMEKIWNWKKIEFWEPPLGQKNISLNYLKLPKTHYKTNLLFVQLRYLKSTFKFGKTWKFGTPPPSYKKSKFWILDFLIFGADPPFLDFFIFIFEALSISRVLILGLLFIYKVVCQP